MSTRSEFLVVYDYGGGGVWAFILATSEKEVVERYPDLRIVTDHPEWMKAEEERSIRVTMTIDIEDEENAFLAALRGHHPPSTGNK